MATGGNYLPYEGYTVPWWWNVIQAARFFGCHPEDIMTRPSIWNVLAARCQEIEEHAREVHNASNSR